MPLIPARNSWAKSGRQAVRAQMHTWRRSQFDMARTSFDRVKHNKSVVSIQEDSSRQAAVLHFETNDGPSEGANACWHCTYWKYGIWKMPAYSVGRYAWQNSTGSSISATWASAQRLEPDVPELDAHRDAGVQL